MRIINGVKFQVKTVNQERFFNQLSKEIKVFDLKRIDHTTCEFCVEFLKGKKTEKKLKEFNVLSFNSQKFGILNYSINFFKRIGIVVGIVFAIFAHIIISNFVFNASIIGNEKISKQEIMSVLEQNDISGFILKSKLSTKNVEKLIMHEFENISLVSAIIKGNTLVISIKEKIESTNQDENFTPLTSNYSGLITSVKLIQGTLKVKVGDIVKVGDVLVEPYIYDSSGNMRKVKAEAEIFARVWYVGKLQHLCEKIETVKTGKKQVYSNITFLGLNLFSNENNPPFENYELQVTKSCISKNNILPIYRQIFTYYETKQVLIKQSFDEVKDEVLKKAKEKTLLLVEECDIILNEYFNISSIGTITFVEYVIEVEKRIDEEAK